MYILTQTPLHVGTGNEVGIVDAPIQRESHTKFPIIPGSSIKGVIRDYMNTPGEGDKLFGIESKHNADGSVASVSEGDKLFGTESKHAGRLSFGEAKLLLFPLRSAKGCYALATCPLALSRFFRAINKDISIPTVDDAKCYCAGNIKIDNAVVLEEYKFEVIGGIAENIIGTLKDNMLKDGVLEKCNNFIILSDGDFSDFSKTACQVQQHIAIDHDTGVTKDGALFNMEVVPSETLFFSSIISMNNDADSNAVFEKFSETKLVQFGGKASTGLGFCSVKIN